MMTDWPPPPAPDGAALPYTPAGRYSGSAHPAGRGVHVRGHTDAGQVSTCTTDSTGQRCSTIRVLPVARCQVTRKSGPWYTSVSKVARSGPLTYSSAWAVARAQMFAISAARCSWVASRHGGMVPHAIPVGAVRSVSGVTYGVSGPTGSVTRLSPPRVRISCTG